MHVIMWVNDRLSRIVSYLEILFECSYNFFRKDPFHYEVESVFSYQIETSEYHLKLRCAE
jgi:hypothetical protein